MGLFDNSREQWMKTVYAKSDGARTRAWDKGSEHPPQKKRQRSAHKSGAYSMSAFVHRTKSWEVNKVLLLTIFRCVTSNEQVTWKQTNWNAGWFLPFVVFFSLARSFILARSIFCIIFFVLYYVDRVRVFKSCVPLHTYTLANVFTLSMYIWMARLGSVWFTSRMCANLPNRYFHFSIFHLNLIVRRNKKKYNNQRTNVQTFEWKAWREKSAGISQCLKWNVRWRWRHVIQYNFFPTSIRW